MQQNNSHREKPVTYFMLMGRLTSLIVNAACTAV